MEVVLRESQDSDFSFLQEMLYEAVFWRDRADNPSFAAALAYPEVSKALAHWGERDGDTAVVATVNSDLAGAAWYRYWRDDNYINGYVDESTPVLVIGVHQTYRRLGIGTKLLDWLIHRAAEKAIERISLSVSKDNHAIHLYRKQGFVEFADRGDQFLMLHNL